MGENRDKAIPAGKNKAIIRLAYKLNPAVDRKILILLAGLAWCGVGLFLISFAVRWLAAFHGSTAFLFYSAGFLAAMPIHHFGFLKLADKNLSRLLPLDKKKCLFGFITWKSYIIIAVMMAMGITMRHSQIPKQYLSILYNGIGLGLFLSGIRYVRTAARLASGREKDQTKKYNHQ